MRWNKYCTIALQSVSVSHLLSRAWKTFLAIAYISQQFILDRAKRTSMSANTRYLYCAPLHDNATHR